ncbi:MAG: phosphopantetheine attachment protein [Nitrospiraceae bacterium]
MDISQDMIAEVVERFIRTEYQVSDKDALFTRDAHLFDLGFVDSLGFTELIAFIETRFGIRLDDDHLFSEDFTTINGMSRVIGSLIDQSPLEPANSKEGMD